MALRTRKAGQIEVGDTMVIRGLVTRTEFNGKEARIIAPDTSSTTDRWKAKVLDEEEEPIISVATEKLLHVGPDTTASSNNWNTSPQAHGIEHQAVRQIYL